MYDMWSQRQNRGKLLPISTKKKKKQSQEKHFTLAHSADAVEREPSSALTAVRTQQVCAAVADAHAACTTLVNV